jgi:UDP-glucose 4-epimerase
MVLVSGATGFVGSRLCRALIAEGVEVRELSRRACGGNAIGADLNDSDALRSACTGVESVFHCAGYAHAFASLSVDDAAEHWRVNFEGTRNLVAAAAQAGVRRFIFLSSVKAMAEPGQVCVDEDFPGEPVSAYGQSKLAAENVVMDVARHNGIHAVNLRLAMVYGSGGRGNLERMGSLVKKGIFPPLPETGNHRSLVHVDDVVLAMRLVAGDSRACGKTYIVAHREAPSGRVLYDALRVALGMPQCRWTLPGFPLWFVARVGDGIEKLLNKRLPLDTQVVERLLGSAWYSPARIDRELGWRANVALADGLLEMFKK